MLSLRALISHVSIEKLFDQIDPDNTPELSGYLFDEVYHKIDPTHLPNRMNCFATLSPIAPSSPTSTRKTPHHTQPPKSHHPPQHPHPRKTQKPPTPQRNPHYEFAFDMVPGLSVWIVLGSRLIRLSFASSPPYPFYCLLCSTLYFGQKPRTLQRSPQHEFAFDMVPRLPVWILLRSRLIHLSFASFPPYPFHFWRCSAWYVWIRLELWHGVFLKSTMKIIYPHYQYKSSRPWCNNKSHHISKITTPKVQKFGTRTCLQLCLPMIGFILCQITCDTRICKWKLIKSQNKEIIKCGSFGLSLSKSNSCPTNSKHNHSPEHSGCLINDTFFKNGTICRHLLILLCIFCIIITISA